MIEAVMQGRRGAGGSQDGEHRLVIAVMSKRGRHRGQDKGQDWG